MLSSVDTTTRHLKRAIKEIKSKLFFSKKQQNLNRMIAHMLVDKLNGKPCFVEKKNLLNKEFMKHLINQRTYKTDICA